MIELHLHLDGAISLRSARQLADLQHIAIPESYKELHDLMRVNPDCKSLNEFLERFAFPCSLIQTREGLALAVENLCNELLEQGVRYAEIRFAPSKHCEKGLSQEQAVLAAIEGKKRSKMHANLILCCMRGSDYDTNAETICLAKKYLHQGVCAADLAGAESLFPTADYEKVFALARELDLPFTIHAGEADGFESVKKALEMGAKRIGHGIRSKEDPKTLQYIIDHQIPLEMCPTSNVQTCVVDEITQLPIKQFLEMGVKVTINTDDPSIEGTSLKEEWDQVISVFHLTDEQIKQIEQNALDAAFLAPGETIE